MFRPLQSASASAAKSLNHNSTSSVFSSGASAAAVVGAAGVAAGASDADSPWSYTFADSILAPRTSIVDAPPSRDKNTTSQTSLLRRTHDGYDGGGGGGGGGRTDMDYVMIYNRVPKTGSTTFANIVYALCEQNRFTMIYVRAEKNAHIYTLADQVSCLHAPHAACTRIRARVIAAALTDCDGLQCACAAWAVLRCCRCTYS